MPRKKETEEQKEKRLAHDEKVRIQRRKVEQCGKELDFIMATMSWKGDYAIPPAPGYACHSVIGLLTSDVKMNPQVGLLMGLANKVIEERILEYIKNDR